MRDTIQRAVMEPARSAMRAVNDRHPWNHNDAFHPWILTRLPKRRGVALDVGCGRGELVAALAPHFEEVRGIDIDPVMRENAGRRCAGLENVTISSSEEQEQPSDVDLLTMVAVLHHLNLSRALSDVHRVLRPGGRFLCVGLAEPAGFADRAWEAVCVITNPLIGFVRHPWPATDPGPRPEIPLRDPELSLDEITRTVERQLPGAIVKRRLGFRHTIEWTKPDA